MLVISHILDNVIPRTDPKGEAPNARPSGIRSIEVALEVLLMRTVWWICSYRSIVTRAAHSVVQCTSESRPSCEEPLVILASAANRDVSVVSCTGRNSPGTNGANADNLRYCVVYQAFIQPPES